MRSRSPRTALDTAAGKRPPPPLTPGMHLALGQLLQAHDAAHGLHQSPWDFALEIEVLKQAGLNHNELRVLICHGLVAHAVEKTTPQARCRSFRPASSLRLLPKSCFTISDWGLLIARQVAGQDNATQANGADGSALVKNLIPVWNSEIHELRLGELLVKRFTQPAKNQERILTVFQEDGWPWRIDDPLPGDAGIDARERLHSAVKRLNYQTHRLIRFAGDGTGEGVIWRLA